jgi:hypothetical protein
VHVGQKCDLLKREKGDAERQDQPHQLEVGCEHSVGRIEEEVPVFEIAEKQDVEHHSDGEKDRPHARRSQIGAQHKPRDQIVEHDARNEDRDVLEAGTGVKGNDATISQLSAAGRPAKRPNSQKPTTTTGKKPRTNV